MDACEGWLLQLASPESQMELARLEYPRKPEV